MLRKTRSFVVILAFSALFECGFAVFCPQSLAEEGVASKTVEVHEKSLSFMDAFIRMPLPEAQSTTVYMTIVNNTDRPDKLISASSKLAEHVELHRIMNDHGLRRMHEVEEIMVPPHGSAVLKFGTYHLMLIGLKQPLVVGMKVPVSLRFASAGRVRLILPVVDVRAKKSD